MLDLDALAFLGAATNLARVHQVFSSLEDVGEEILIPKSIQLIKNNVEQFSREAEKLNARLALVLAQRFVALLEKDPCEVTVRKAISTMDEIESRFADYIADVKLFVLYPEEALFLNSADNLIELDGFSARFPNAAFEVEEAAKCAALGRYTAAVFHAMRMLEVGIRALSKRLGIPDPTKPAEKNWGNILRTIKGKIDETWPLNHRIAGSEGSEFDQLYATLDAVKNPWRNATMHVETIYAPHEALHILRCAAFFMRKLYELTDEEGVAPPEPGLPELLNEAGQPHH